MMQGREDLPESIKLVGQIRSRTIAIALYVAEQEGLQQK